MQAASATVNPAFENMICKKYRTEIRYSTSFVSLEAGVSHSTGRVDAEYNISECR